MYSHWKMPEMNPVGPEEGPGTGEAAPPKKATWLPTVLAFLIFVGVWLLWGNSGARGASVRQAVQQDLRHSVSWSQVQRTAMTWIHDVPGLVAALQKAAGTPAPTQSHVPPKVAGAWTMGFSGAAALSAYGWQSNGSFQNYVVLESPVPQATVEAPTDGRVLAVETASAAHGQTIVEGIGSVQATFQGFGAVAVKAGQTVNRGQTLGTLAGQTLTVKLTVSGHSLDPLSPSFYGFVAPVHP